jgi:hypothetical protein
LKTIGREGKEPTRKPLRRICERFQKLLERYVSCGVRENPNLRAGIKTCEKQALIN